MQTYCTREDVEAVWSADDVADSPSTTTAAARFPPLEEGYIDRAIERAAGKMNACLGLALRTWTDLADNAWCRDVNAALAAYLLATRRGLAAPGELRTQYEDVMADLAALRAGRLQVPGAGESHATTGTVTNFTVALSRSRDKVQPVPETSTGNS